MKSLKKVLQELSDKGVRGVNNHERVIREMGEVSDFMFEVNIVYNNRFSLVYNHDFRSFELNTTYSNQIIDEDFIEEMNLLNKAKNILDKEVSK